MLNLRTVNRKTTAVSLAVILVVRLKPANGCYPHSFVVRLNVAMIGRPGFTSIHGWTRWRERSNSCSSLPAGIKHTPANFYDLSFRTITCIYLIPQIQTPLASQTLPLPVRTDIQVTINHPMAMRAYRLFTTTHETILHLITPKYYTHITPYYTHITPGFVGNLFGGI